MHFAIYIALFFHALNLTDTFFLKIRYLNIICLSETTHTRSFVQRIEQ